MSKKYEDLSGIRFGKLIVLNRIPEIKKRVTWLCKCDCGNTTSVGSSALKMGVTKSCGCLVPNSMRARENREKESRALNHIIPNIPLKICTKCKKELPLTQFQFYGKNIRNIALCVMSAGMNIVKNIAVNLPLKHVKNYSIVQEIRLIVEKEHNCLEIRTVK